MSKPKYEPRGTVARIGDWVFLNSSLLPGYYYIVGLSANKRYVLGEGVAGDGQVKRWQLDMNCCRVALRRQRTGKRGGE